MDGQTVADSRTVADGRNGHEASLILAEVVTSLNLSSELTEVFYLKNTLQTKKLVLNCRQNPMIHFEL